MTTEVERTLRTFNYVHEDITNLIQSLTDDLEVANEESQRLREECDDTASDLVNAEGNLRALDEENGRLEGEIERLKEEAAE